jgi:hypothetical protein
MGIWLDALDQAACGDLPGALERVRVELPAALRRFAETDEGSRTYAGPVMNAVRRHAAKFGDADRRQVARYECDLVDAIVDDVVAAVERSLHLVDLCREDLGATLDVLVERFPWAPRLKRDAAWRRAWIASMLRSMLAEGLPLPPDVAVTLGGEGEARFEFNEMAFAAAPDRIDLTWKGLRRRMGLDHEYYSLVDDEEATGVGDESVDYGGVRVSKASFDAQSHVDVEMELVLHLVGKELTHELTELLESMHASKPTDGYRPVAWHCVFWNIQSEYEGLRLALHVLDPFCGTDGELAAHIVGHYADVKATSRVAVLRRRQALGTACEERIQSKIMEKVVGA